MISRKKKILFTIITISVTTLLSLAAAEITFRILLFSNVSFMEPLRNPRLYADWMAEDECWLLGYIFNKYPPPQKTHPQLGWSRKIFHKTYLHHKYKEVGSRRPVLLYGDSFARCEGLPQSDCYEALFNQQEDFLQEYYFLNYGAGGYGMGQIYLLFKNSVDNYENPFIIMSLMTYDVDRVLLSVRGGQKPYFELENGELVVKGTPVEENSEDFFKQNKPKIFSYLYRLMLYGNILPSSWYTTLTNQNQKNQKKIAINKVIFDHIFQILEERELDYFFVVYQPYSSIKRNGTWRDTLIHNILDQYQAPQLWMDQVIKEDQAKSGKELIDYFLHNGGHPNPYFHKIMAQRMKEKIYEMTNP